MDTMDKSDIQIQPTTGITIRSRKMKRVYICNYCSRLKKVVHQKGMQYRCPDCGKKMTCVEKIKP
jgi:DNA-directed RNA polymerase subunit RPC12/RpoP